MTYFPQHTDASSRAKSTPEADLPSACPACHSSSIATTTKIPDASSYWRCTSCGEVWNVSRRQAVRRGANPWR